MSVKLPDAQAEVERPMEQIWIAVAATQPGRDIVVRSKTGRWRRPSWQQQLDTIESRMSLMPSACVKSDELSVRSVPQLLKTVYQQDER